MTRTTTLEDRDQGRPRHGVALEPLVSRCRLEVKSEILGDSVFWEGGESETTGIRSIPGRAVAEAVFRTGEPKSWGMWHGYPCG